MNTLATLTLKKKWETLKEENPHLRIRNAAQELGVSEVELLATQEGETATRLKPQFQDILKKVETLGKVMALTRNDKVVHERKGTYLNPSLDNPHVGLFVGEDIDLRIFFQCWKYAFAVTEGEGKKMRQSLQFFAKDGNAVHKIYLTPTSNVEAFEDLVDSFKENDSSTSIEVTPMSPADAEKPDQDIDIDGFQKEWIDLKDTHHFFSMLKKYGVTRTQALRLAPEGGYSVKIQADAFVTMLEGAAEREIEIMVFVGNPGMIQIHTGPVKKLVGMEGWYNVLDPDFNLHVKTPEITDAWVVRKPTEDGMVTAIECFNKDGEQVVQFFGKRKPGIPELETWSALVQEIENQFKI